MHHLSVGSFAGLLCVLSVLSCGASLAANDGGRTFYVDSAAGLDANSGESPERAWASLDRVNAAELRPGDTVRFKCGGMWRGSLVPASGDEGLPVRYTSFGEGPKPLFLGSTPRNQPSDWVKVREKIWGTLPSESRKGGALSVDVGNVIFDDGAVCGWKKWAIDDLRKPYDYFYERSSQRVFLCLEDNPAARHRSVELALARHMVKQDGKHHVVYDGLALKYGASHGFGGGATHHLIIRNCDLGYIGGAHQHTRPDGTPVRFGNAIEFWGAAHDNLVEGCRIWEIYDAALTNQGRGPDSKEVNITYRNNFIRNAEYSFEYWNGPETAVTKNIRFLNNTCVNAGTVWSHAQRPDPNGSHLMFYSNTAETSGVEVKYNIFYNATDWGSRYSSGWKVLPDMDDNLWFTNTGVACWWFDKKIGSFDEYRRETKLDAHSQFADPLFVDAAHGDYRLKPDSPARKLRTDGGPVGAEMFWK
jgi:hypothetical protein